MKYSPMLAKKAADPKRVLARSDMYSEIKMDGIRCISEYGRLHSRNGVDVTWQFAEVAADVANCGLTKMILDGELVCHRNNKPDWTLTERRLHTTSVLQRDYQVENHPATLYVFDILEIDSKTEKGVAIPVLNFPLRERRLILQEVAENIAVPGLRVQVLGCVTGMGQLLFDRVKQAGLEGVMCKDPLMPYIPGARTDYWLKVKVMDVSQFYVCGIAKGANRELGSLILAEFSMDTLRLVYVGRVASGLTEKDLQRYYNEPVGDPVIGWPQDKQVVRWIQPVTIDVTFSERTRNGHLRSPRIERS